MTDSEHKKTAALNDVADEVETERAQHGRSEVDGQPVVDNSPDTAEVEDDAGLAQDPLVVPPLRPSGN